VNKRFSVVAVGMLIWLSTAQAQTNSPERLKQLAKLPDWSGIWQSDGSFRTFDADSSANPKAAAAAAAAAAAKDTLADTFGGAPRDHAPYTAEWEAKYAKMLAGGNTQMPDTNTRYCAAGVPRVMASPFQFEISVWPQETMMVFTQREVRHIWTDGRAHPADDDLWPMLWGDSIGHWEGQTLVIDTVSLKADIWLDPTAATLSDKAHIKERLRQIGSDELQDDVEIDDPVALTKPWLVTRRYRRIHDFNRMIDEVCNENDRDPIIDGKVQPILKVP